MTESRRVPPLLAALFCTAMCITSPADSRADRPVGTHEHGVSRMNVVLDRRALLIELEGPSANFVSFEHGPRTANEKSDYAAAIARLRDPAGLYRLPAAAQCTLVKAQLLEPDFRLPAGAKRRSHTDLAAAHEFECRAPFALGAFEVLIFKAFPRTSRVELQLLSPVFQSRQVLLPGSPRVRLRPDP